MIFEYEEKIKLENGFYIVEVTYEGEKPKREVAEYMSGGWFQTGLDWDVYLNTIEIKVIAKIHLDDCTITEM